MVFQRIHFPLEEADLLLMLGFRVVAFYSKKFSI